MLITLTSVGSIQSETTNFPTPGKHSAWRDGGKTLAFLWDYSVGPLPTSGKTFNRSQSNEHILFFALSIGAVALAWTSTMLNS